MGNLRVTREQIEAEFPGLKICCDDISLAALVDLIGINKTLIIADECYNGLKIPALFALACARKVQDDQTKKILDDLENFLIGQSSTRSDMGKIADKINHWQTLGYAGSETAFYAVRAALYPLYSAVDAHRASGCCLASADNLDAEKQWQESELIRIIESTNTKK